MTGPIARNARIQTRGVFAQTASATTPTVSPYSRTMVSALRNDGMRRSSSRHSGTGLAMGVSRLSGRGATRRRWSGTIEPVARVRVSPVLVPAVLASPLLTMRSMLR